MGATHTLRVLVLAALILMAGGIHVEVQTVSVARQYGMVGQAASGNEGAATRLGSEDRIDALRASWWTAGIMRYRVEAVAGGDMRERSDAGVAVWGLRRSVVHTETRAIICADPWACFRQGFQDFDGNPEWEDRFVDVLLCEGDYWVGYSGPPVSRYISRAQFDPGSWATVTAATELGDPDNPYHVGANMAWWSGAISHPGDGSGWPGCW